MKIITEQQIFKDNATSNICVFVHPQHDDLKRTMKWAEKLGIPFANYRDAEYLIYDFTDVNEALKFSESFNDHDDDFYACTFVDGVVIDDDEETATIKHVY